MQVSDCEIVTVLRARRVALTVYSIQLAIRYLRSVKLYRRMGNDTPILMRRLAVTNISRLEQALENLRPVSIAKAA